MMKSLRLALIALCALALASCDSVAPTDQPSAENALSFSPIPQGQALVPPGLGKSLQDTAFGCFVSSPNIGAPDEQRYRYEAFFLHFPQDVLDEAQHRKRVVMLHVGSDALFADEQRSHPVLLRVVRCVIPDTDAAQLLVEQQSVRFAPSQQSRWQGEPLGVPPGSVLPVSSGKSGGYWETVLVAVYTCMGPPEVVMPSKNAAGEVCGFGGWREEQRWVSDPGGVGAARAVAQAWGHRWWRRGRSAWGHRQHRRRVPGGDDAGGVCAAWVST